MQSRERGWGTGKGTSVRWNCSLTAISKEHARVRRERHSAGHKLEPEGPRGSRTETDGSRRHVCGLTRPHLPPIYLCLPYRPFTPAFIAARAARREQSTDGTPGPPRAREVPGIAEQIRAGIDRKIHHLRAPQSRRTVTWYPIRLRTIPGCGRAAAQAYANARFRGSIRIPRV